MIDRLQNLARNRDVLRSRIEEKIAKREALDEEIRRMQGYLDACRAELKECCSKLKKADIRAIVDLVEAED